MATIKLRTIIKHPARVEGGTAISVTKEGGVYTYDLDLASLSAADTIIDDAKTYLAIVTPAEVEGDADVHEIVSVEKFLTETAAVNQSRQVISGAGLTGGGDLSADRTLAVGAGTGITVNADDVALNTSHVRNVDHSAVTITAGAGLTGGGTIESTRTLNVGAGTGITVNADDVALAAISDQRVMANVSGGSAAPSANTLTAILDAILGSTQGALLTRQGSAWVKLDPGTSGHFLKSQGAAANLTYAAVPGGGDLLSTNNLSDVSNKDTALANLNAFSTGDVKVTIKTTADTGWVMMDDGTIGSATSGATTRANADTSNLYTLIWNNISNTYAAVSGGRGASAAADFAANKTIALPKMLGRLLGGAGAGSGLTSRAAC